MNTLPQAYNGKPFVHSWDYCDIDGNKIGVVGRYQTKGEKKKEFLPFFKWSGSKLTAGIDINPRPLFGLDKLATHRKDKAVFIPEGERKAATFHGLGITAVTSIGGSNAAKQTDWTPLNGCKMVYLEPDNDAPGEHYAEDVYRALMALESPPRVQVLRLSGLPVGGDIVDWVQGWVGGWDGYSPIDETHHKGLKEALLDELKNAEPVPESWNVAVNASAEFSGFNWEKPNKIETNTPPVQALSPEMIPSPFKGLITDISHNMQTPCDFATVSMITVASSVIGAGCRIRPKAIDNSFQVTPNLWGSVIAPPSKKKTPTMGIATGFLDRLQAEYSEQFERDKKCIEFDDEIKQSKGVGA